MARSRHRLLGLVLGALVLAAPLGACSRGSAGPTEPRPTEAEPAPTRGSAPALGYHLAGYGLEDRATDGGPASADLADVPAGKPGELVSSAPVTAPDGIRAWRVVYHSRGPQNEDRLVTGLVLAPPADSPVPPGGRPLVSFGHGTTGINDACAPSRAEPPLSTIGGTLRLVRDGYVLAVTDYTGLGGPGEHPIYEADSAAKALLDAARAARSLRPAQAGEDVVLWGYSQGGQAALAAGAVAADYAPDLRVLGSAATAPLVDLPASLHDMRTLPDGVAYLLLAVTGLAAADPALSSDAILTATGRRLTALAHNRCAGDLLLASTGESVTSVFARDPLRTEPFASALERQWQYVQAPGPPRLVLQGGLDTVIHQATTDRAVSALCAAGGSVEYHRYGLANHGTVIDASVDDLSRWVAARFAGAAAPTGICATP
ncbi:lipase family protein [Parafrankia sp. FMc2]|uniref:lipase family protein n=1 Tax=Parafrankia sp. FMc2 TaxID=3233196 RepID=UPI0034D414B0